MPALAAGCPRTVPAFDAYHDAKCVCPLERLERRAGNSRCDVSEGDRLTDIRGQREFGGLSGTVRPDACALAVGRAVESRQSAGDPVSPICEEPAALISGRCGSNFARSSDALHDLEVSTAPKLGPKTRPHRRGEPAERLSPDSDVQTGCGV